MTTARRLGLGQLVLLCLVLTGCQPRSTTLNPVAGKVAYNGAPLRGGLIVFTPDSSRGESGKVASAKINRDGTYTLMTGDVAGATAGWYRVTVASLQENADPRGIPVSVLPEKYLDPTTSMLNCEVKPNRTNQLDFNLD
jgi:hypothetical protein